MDMSIFLDDFEAEARLHIEKIENAFLNLSEMDGSLAAVNSVFRAAHSLKATAGFLNLDKIVAVAHGLENILARISTGELTLNTGIADTALESVDYLNQILANTRLGDDTDISVIVGKLDKYAKNNAPAGATPGAQIPFDVDSPETREAIKDAHRFGHKVFYIYIGYNRSLGAFYKHPEKLIDGILSVGAIISARVDGAGAETGALALAERLGQSDTSVLELLVSSVLDAELLQAALELDKKNIHQIMAQPSEKKTLSAPMPENSGSQSIRLDVAAINHLMDLANEMILTRNQLLSTLSGYKKPIDGLTHILHDISRLTSEIQEKVMLTRMQPISLIFNKFPRVIRDTARALNKNIALDIVNDNVMLDKYLLEALIDPITQIVKNSADHGIETPQKRAAAGKPKNGSITLNAFMRDGAVIIEVKDDGAGIDTEALKRRGIERGVITQEEIELMTERDICNLIFEPGLSTAEQVTNLSGRGMGMDIVQTNIQRLGGTIELESERGVGTVTRIKTPITLSVTGTLIVLINGVLYAVPEINIERIVRLKRDTPGKRLERANHSLVLALNERIIPVVTVDEIEARAYGIKPPSGKKLLDKAFASGIAKCLVLKAGEACFALLIDNAVETEQILVKPLPVFLKNCGYYSGATILGNGKAITILDAEGIVRHMGLEIAENKANYGGEGLPLGPVDEEKQLIIFKASGPEYYTLETRDILRIETILPEYIQEAGGNMFINIAGKAIRIIDPEDLIKIKKHAHKQKKLYLLTLKNSVPLIGLLASKVLDKVEGAFAVDTGQIRGAYVHGAITYHEKILIYLNPAAIKTVIKAGGVPA